MTDSTPESPAITEAPKTRKVQQRTIAGKARIIDAAAELFIRHGYRGTSVNDIIAESGTSKNFFYARFPEGKKDVAAVISHESTWDGLQTQRLMTQEMIDIGLILAHRVKMWKESPLILAALKLSFEFGAEEEYGSAWRDWVAFNTGQIAEAQKRGEIRPHIVPEQQARQLPGFWAGLILTGGVLDRSYDHVEEYVLVAYQNFMKAVAVPEIMPDLVWAVDRGEKLYTEFLRKEEETQGSAAV
ncbi:TetR/AcrR family transcriptional regulator (plasmid) [Streptomyces sp. NBC_01281]|uniref:TetR/AcrR family transcriptional regulator n=1 Tax=Streptomyces sp. NBC_01281 TaxID=2903811 RepID=UPI002E13897F|nr:TetR/AcrR family transcriptional regulator [Streptomyces sp. NBC_01281]